MKKMLKAVLYFVFFIAVGIVSAYFTFYFLSTTVNYEVPNLSGKNLLEANRLLNEKNLILKIEGEAYDADIPSGYILKQTIPAGNLIKTGRRVGVIISKGPKILYTPVFSGLLLEEAENLARRNNIKIDGIIKVHSGGVENDRVIAQDPNPEEHGAGGITLIVSVGPRDDFLVCPLFKDMRIDEAKELAQRLGLYITTSGEGSKVAAQNPPVPSLVKKGDTIKLELEEEEEIRWWL